MKTYRQLKEAIQTHDTYNKWQAAASKHPKFARFDTAANTRLKEFGSKKLTIYALDHQSNPIGVYSHSFGRGNIISEEQDVALDEVSHETMMRYRAAAKEDAKYRDGRAKALKSDANMERAYSKTASDPEARDAYARWAEDSDALSARAEHRAKKRREGVARAARLSLARSS